MKQLFLSAGILLLCWQLRAQTFSYNFSQSQSVYQPLSGATLIANSSTWSASGYKIPIGFSFAFMGKNFDTLTITSNGLILFGDDNKRAIAAFKGIIPVKDSTNTYSSISYSSSGNVLKIEYKNVGFDIICPNNFNFQMWLSQQGNKVEFHTGTTVLTPCQNTLVLDSMIMPVVGLLNPSMSDSANNGCLLSGNPSQPSAETLIADLKYMIRLPDPNTVYTLTPQ